MEHHTEPRASLILGGTSPGREPLESAEGRLGGGHDSSQSKKKLPATGSSTKNTSTDVAGVTCFCALAVEMLGA